MKLYTVLRIVGHVGYVEYVSQLNVKLVVAREFFGTDKSPKTQFFENSNTERNEARILLRTKVCKITNRIFSM